MADAYPVRCPSCRRPHDFDPPVYPCGCGAALTVPLLRGGVPVPVTLRVTGDAWVRMYCPRCGAADEWPRPEYTCGCGTVVRLPVDTESHMRRTRTGPAPAPPGGRRAGAVRPAFRPLPVRTAADARQTALRYLLWLGHTGVHPAPDRGAPDGVAILGPTVAAQVESWAMPATVRAVELLWLHTLHENVPGAFFSVAGYREDAAGRGEQLGIALFAVDTAGSPRPVNDTARRFLG